MNGPFLNEQQITVNSAWLAKVLAIIALLLLTVSLIAALTSGLANPSDMSGFRRFLYVDAENNAPTYFSVVLMIMNALLLATLAVRTAHSGSNLYPYWAGLSLGFFCMGFDESFEIHERFMKPMRKLIGEDDLGIFYYSWVIPALLLIAFLGLLFWRFLAAIRDTTRLRLIVAGTLYLGGAIGAEMLGGWYVERNSQANVGYLFIVTAEEGLEMAGLIALFWAVLRHHRDEFGAVRLQFL